MKTHTHTQGPWKVENWKYKESLILWRRDGVPTIVGGHDAIAEILNLYRPDDDATGESEAMANARLIAAAPELLAACRLALGVFRSQFPLEHGSPEIGAAWGALESVMERAIG